MVLGLNLPPEFSASHGVTWSQHPLHWCVDCHLTPFHPVSLMRAAELGSSHPVHLGGWLTSSETHSTFGLKINRRLPGPTYPILRKMNSDHKPFGKLQFSKILLCGVKFKIWVCFRIIRWWEWGGGYILNAFFFSPLTDSESGGLRWDIGSPCFQIILKNPDAIGPWTAFGCVGS